MDTTQDTTQVVMIGDDELVLLNAATQQLNPIAARIVRYFYRRLALIEPQFANGINL